jgi:bis(5'-nucleosyl)-tetraphosphatase (symmetrical)
VSQPVSEPERSEQTPDLDIEPPALPRSTYAIGDVQGCFDDLLRLLDKIEFDPVLDRLWFTGDLVNRGPDSLALLRYVKGLGGAAVSVLGNHDLNLLSAAAGRSALRRKDTIAEILEAPDCEELLFWLRHQQLLHHDERLGFTMVHAGLPPQWDLDAARRYANELETVLQNFAYEDLFKNLSMEKPWRWRDELAGWERLRYIANSFTQMRYCDCAGRLDMSGERRKQHGKKKSMPWFEIPKRNNRDLNILFGHWASLANRNTKRKGVFPLDTGCADKGVFTALRLEDKRFFRVRCKNKAIPWGKENPAG